MKRLRSIAMLTLLASACGRSAPPAEPIAADEPEPLSVTRWTDRTELFAEYPPLVAGETSRFAIHLTTLDPFKAVTEGRVEVYLRGGGGDEVFRADGPSRPGIFGVDVTPSRPGTRQLVIVLQAPGLEDRHDVGVVSIHATAEAALSVPAEGEEAAEGISFLKEQQWNLDFGTARVTEEAVRESIQVAAQVEPRHGGAADVVAPIDGRLLRVLDAPLGSRVTRGQELARLLPPPSIPTELPQLERARAEARAALTLAVHDRERAERLTTAGAAPRKRLEEARAVEEQVRARLSAAEASLGQYHSARSGEGANVADGLFIVRAPVAGVVAWRDAAAGANVTAGARLFHVVDASQVHIVGHVPESEAARASMTKAAEIELPGEGGRVPAGRLASVGRVLDPQSRTLPITFRFDNRTRRLPVGQALLLHLMLDAAAPRASVPAGAIVDDAGRPIVFVQREGETFERRPVTLGPREGDRVQILEGVDVGERVVTRGAYLVRLASLSTSVPAHGHVH